MLTLPLAGCFEPDDAALIATARETCVRLAKAHLRKLSDSQNIELGIVPNTESDPGDNMFEFVWRKKDITGSSAAEETIWCRGDAGAKIITRLSVGDDVIAAPQTY